MNSQSYLDNEDRVKQEAHSFSAADRDAVLLRRELERRRHAAFAATCGCITVMAASSVLLHNPAPQVLCPVAVFLMLLYFDRLRSSPLIFLLASTRLLSETQRVMQAAQAHPQLLRDAIDWRVLSTHPVTASAAIAARTLVSSPPVGAREADHWGDWLKGQQAYYCAAHSREQKKAWRARLLFNCAFGLVALIALGAGTWVAVDKSASATDSFRFLLAAASAVGSVALAYSNLVREQKAFEQSVDYGHLSGLFVNLGQDAEKATSDTARRTLLRASLDEHARWALRVAGHFTKPPSEITADQRR